MKTMWNSWSKLLLVSWLGVLSALPATAGKNPEPMAQEQTETSPTHVELLRMGQTDDSFEGVLVELESGQIIYEQSGKGAAALAQYHKVVDTLVPPELRIQLVVPRGVPQADPGPLPTPPCAQGDESVWVRFAVQVTSDYLAMERPLSESLKEPVHFVEVLRLNPTAGTFAGEVLDANTRQSIYRASGSQSTLADYQSKVEAIARKPLRVQAVLTIRDTGGQGSSTVNPPVPPGPTGHDWILQKFMYRTVHGIHSARVEEIGDALQVP